MKLFRFHKSFNSVVIGLVESGTFIPPEIAAKMTRQAHEFRSADRNLIELCECSQLRDTGLIATHVSPLVVDLTKPLPESPPDSSLQSLYCHNMPDGQPFYPNAQPPVRQSDHQLRRGTFYLPFFQKMNAELDRLITKFGSATLLILAHNPSLDGRQIVLADTTTKDPGLGEIGVIYQPSNADCFIGMRPESSLVRTYKLTLSSDCFLTDDANWSTRQADQTRDVLAHVVQHFAVEQ